MSVSVSSHVKRASLSLRRDLGHIWPIPDQSHYTQTTQRTNNGSIPRGKLVYDWRLLAVVIWLGKYVRAEFWRGHCIAWAHIGAKPKQWNLLKITCFYNQLKIWFVFVHLWCRLTTNKESQEAQREPYHLKMRSVRFTNKRFHIVLSFIVLFFSQWNLEHNARLKTWAAGSGFREHFRILPNSCRVCIRSL